MRHCVLFPFIFVLALRLPAEVIDTDLYVFGGSSAGIARPFRRSSWARVALVEPSQYLSGLSCGWATMAEGPCDAAKHPHIDVTGSPNVLEYIGPGKCASVTFDVFRTEGLNWSQKLAFAFASLWPKNIPAKTYTITAETCGNRTSGKAVGGGAVTVEVFPCEQYALSLKLPAFKKGAYKIDSKIKYDSKKKEYVAEDRTTESSQTGVFANKQGSSTTAKTTISSDGTKLENSRF